MSQERSQIELLFSTLPEPWDIVRTTTLSAEEYQAIQRDRAIDMARQMSITKEVIPEASRIAAKIVNNLDDLQDILASALVVGKWIAPRAFSRILPGIGTALLVSDVLNLATLIFSSLTPSGLLVNALTRKTLKRRLSDTVTKNPFSLKSLSQSAKDFLNRRTHVGDILQLLQATDSLFGNGLSLGSLYGFSDAAIATLARSLGITKDAFSSWIPGDVQMTATSILKGIESYTAVPLSPADSLRYQVVQARLAAD